MRFRRRRLVRIVRRVGRGRRRSYGRRRGGSGVRRIGFRM